MNNELHTTSTGQITHQDSVKKILPAALYEFFSFHKFCFISFQLEKILPAAYFVSLDILSVGQFISVSYLVYRFIGIENDRIQILSNHNDTTRKEQQ